MRIKLNQELADRFIKQISRYTEYNVNIMDETGKIIATSRNPERVDSFHEGAWRMICENQEMMIIEESSEYLGTKNGVNLLITSGSQPIGVVGVTGRSQEVREIAMIIKMALEAMIAYEEQQCENMYQRSKHEQLHLALFDSKTVSWEKLETLARQLNFDSKCIRVPILLTFPRCENMDTLLNDLQKKYLSGQDMCWLEHDQQVLVYKSLSGSEAEVLGNWRQDTEEWLEQLAQEIPFTQALVGSLQCRLHYYHKGLEHCLWLEKNSFPEKIQYFTDHIADFLDSLVPELELHAIYNVYDRNLDPEFKRSFVSILGSLRHSNFNLVVSSRELFVHKNTLAFRMNKIKSALQANPFQSSGDRAFLEGLLNYWRRKKTP